MPAAHGRKNFILKYPSEEVVLGLRLAYATEPDLNLSQLEEKVKSSASRSTVDQRIFIPYNQAYMLAVTAKGEQETANRLANNKSFTGYLFGPWGDYKGTYGFIYKIKFETIASVYTRSGKNVNSLKSWVRQKFKNNKPYPYIEDWMNGTVFEYA